MRRRARTLGLQVLERFLHVADFVVSQRLPFRAFQVDVARRTFSPIFFTFYDALEAGVTSAAISSPCRRA
jgi:hypothetical protein